MNFFIFFGFIFLRLRIIAFMIKEVGGRVFVLLVIEAIILMDTVMELVQRLRIVVS